jgi:zinc protease
MLNFEKFVLKNGLKVIVNTDTTTPLIAMNILYKVGARNEVAKKTGFAHLFEHLMFGGSVNIPNYDSPLQMAGGENNAFTNNDFTNYYLTIPAQNIETAFWLESDRMLNLAFSEKSLEVQRQVVVEEFRQRYLNQPYGDAWLKLRPLAYKTHPYQWPTIGKEISHIENATLDDVKFFFNRYYHPGNAILTLSGNISVEDAKKLSEKWFEPIPAKEIFKENIPKEPSQTEQRAAETTSDVPFDALYKAWHCCARGDADFHATDLLTDVLSGGKSSRLYNSLVKEKKLFSNINAYMLGDIDPSLVVAEGKLYPGVDIKQAEQALDDELEKLKGNKISDRELNKVRNKAESSLVFGEINIGTRALNLAYYEMLGDAEKINSQVNNLRAVSAENIQQVSQKIFNKNNSSTLYYFGNKK